LFMPALLSSGLSSCNAPNASLTNANNVLDVNQLTELLSSFTDTYRRFDPSDIYLREAACLAVQWRGIVLPIESNDLFAGRSTQTPIGTRAQSAEGYLGYYIHPVALQKLIDSPEISAENKAKLHELKDFWNKENTVTKTKQAFTEEMKGAIPSDDYFGESGIAFSLWRMSGIQFDYGKLIKKGIPGLKEEIEGYKKTATPGSEAEQFYSASLQALNTFGEVCLYYAAMAEQMANEATDASRKKELETMAEVLTNISTKQPASFREALQLMYLYNAQDGARNFGRMDDYLADLYVADIESGKMDEEEAIRLLTGIWSLMAARGYRYDTRLIIGGKGRVNETNADKVALAIMETTNRVKDIVPQVALRFYEGQNPSLYQKALDVIGTGNPFPMLYNDDVNISAVQKAFEVPYEDAVHAIQYGCGEYVMNHRSVGTPSGLINLLQALLVTINKGIDPATGKPMGMPAERYAKYNNFTTFDNLLNAYKEQVEYHVIQLAKHEELEYIYAGKDNPYLYSSILMDDCLAKGKSMFTGGVRYLGGTLESYGNSNTADSLTVIRELVYEKKLFSLSNLQKMLNANFKGFEKERKMMLACPKYGNDHEQADQMLTDIHNHLCNFTRNQKENTSLHSYLVVVINNDANTVMGMKTPASPDGRLAYTYMNPGNNPVGGADKSGLTAFLNSLVKPDPTIHAGAVQNMKFSKELFTKNRPMLEALLATYFKNGGSQAMLTVVSKGDLEEAIKHPE
ncbi:MAG TPA: pyruvate formate lyase family protein, partial [Prolixibacteraceae bacterium]|nr:pyruvate formate lyase family protein [Prolixibacteraceae bacterium]